MPRPARVAPRERTTEPEVLAYPKVLEQLGETRTHLLLGNGFSIACDPIFQYPNLFQYARQNGLPRRVVDVFQHVGTNNFEAVLRLLEDGEWLAKHYGLLPARGRSALREDFEAVRKALVEAVAKTHLEDPSRVHDARKDRCANFLERYYNVFTTNYDLLLYWVEMRALERLQGRDGFLSDPDEPEAEYVVFREHVGGDKGIFYIHGGLHLYAREGQIRKHSWRRSGIKITELVKTGIEQGEYPLFVAEGDPEKKRAHIESNGYLSYCLGKLARMQNNLVVYGFSFGDSDRHILHALAQARKLNSLYIGLYHPPAHPTSRAIAATMDALQARRQTLRNPPLAIRYYDSRSVPVWDEPR